ncbi:MAG: hypothetical protein A2Z89_08050 [Deltaproteobacteria bacterium GWA2_43_19]|uniref:Uncharacterized protein n=1 Tax=Candidatus Gottesmanbacteria bacterium GW2011_GWC2_39_8 TaxID=1618450 RepID=A0A0G0S6N1_9BACT|nr:MAG: hypothetical protein UT63_C0100G0001 [Candidatus Gottesmanbacteria bacterium GW2011_GWC2_39_8]OGP12091.1 MAG: hypothetical protein A2Z89_08050 [Deltaproteobacteria bacterium GWA2_43_19]OGQ12463.1 MAG: hypothetical protein A3D30_00235 [Deltaproteobacteria bacterium RIFCSPHIGHO2_02_FULL_43_33]
MYSEKGQIDKAIEKIQEAIKQEPNHPEMQNNLGTMYFKKGLFEESIKVYKKAFKLNPSSLLKNSTNSDYTDKRLDFTD